MRTAVSPAARRRSRPGESRPGRQASVLRPAARSVRWLIALARASPPGEAGLRMAVDTAEPKSRPAKPPAGRLGNGAAGAGESIRTSGTVHHGASPKARRQAHAEGRGLRPGMNRTGVAKRRASRGCRWLCAEVLPALPGEFTASGASAAAKSATRQATGEKSPAGAATPETAKPVHAPAAMLAAQAPSGRTREAASPVSIGLLPMRCAFAGLEAMKPPGGLQELMAPKALSPAVC